MYRQIWRPYDWSNYGRSWHNIAPCHFWKYSCRLFYIKWKLSWLTWYQHNNILTTYFCWHNNIFYCDLFLQSIIPSSCIWLTHPRATGATFLSLFAVCHLSVRLSVMLSFRLRRWACQGQAILSFGLSHQQQKMLWFFYLRSRD